MPPTSVKSRAQRKRSRVAANDKGKYKKLKTLPPPYLHDNIWFNILSWLSATCLYNIMSRVCNTWASMIRHPYFVETHLCRSSSGIFLQNWRTLYRARFLDIINNKVEITEYKLEYPGFMQSSYQGVSLFYNAATKVYVMNPVTMQLAEISPPDLPPRCIDSSHYSVIRDRRSGELKLVFALELIGNLCSWYVQKLGIENSWKKISRRYKYGTMDFPALSIGGFLVYLLHHSTSVVVFDVSDETIHMICCPKKGCKVTFLPMGNDLSCISPNDSNLIFIYILKDFHAGIWSLYQIIDCRYELGRPLEFQRFVGWISNSEELLVRLCTFGSCYKLGSCYKGSCYRSDKCYRITVSDRWIYFTYNVKSKGIRYLDSYIDELDLMKVHTNSLLSWKTLQA